MNKRTHRALSAALGSLTGISALLAATDPASLDVSAHTWAWVAVGLSVATVVVQAVRQAWESEP